MESDRVTAPFHGKRPTMGWNGDGQQLMPLFAATLWHRYVSMEHVRTGIGRVGGPRRALRIEKLQPARRRAVCDAVTSALHRVRCFKE